jgi:hypothetical protein
MYVHVKGGVELNGLMRVSISVPSIHPGCKVILKGVSRPLKGTIIISEIVSGKGVGLSSTSPEDIGQTVYFEIVEPK